MNLPGNANLHSSTYLEEDILIKKLLLTHDPDGRHLDSELLLCATENIMSYVTSDVQGSGFHDNAIADNDLSSIGVVGSQEPFGLTIRKVLHKMLNTSPAKENLHKRTMIMFDFLENYKWDAKVVLILAAFATSYGDYRLLMQLCPQNPLAVSVAMLKRLPTTDILKLRPRLKALTMLVKTMVDVAKCIIRFECLPFRHVKLDDEEFSNTKSSIYLAAYWVVRSTLACSFEVTDFITMKTDQVNSISTVISVWHLSSLVHRLTDICNGLRKKVDLCHQQIELKLHQKLSNIFQEAHADNQEVLDILLALKDELPLKDSSTKAKIGLSQLKDKVVVLLVTKPELLPLEGLLLLLNQMYDHPHRKKVGSYEIVWLPVSFSETWTNAEAERFILLSNSLPGYSVRRPWGLNSAVLKYIRQEWNYNDEPIMVVLDSQGKIINTNAIDMVLSWGAAAYPFSSSSEKELWKDKNLTMQLLIGEIDPLLTGWVEEGRYICIYGGENTDWIRDFNAKMKEIRSSGFQIEMLYVGNRQMSEFVKHNLAIITSEMHTNLFSLVKLHMFWLRLESIRRSKPRLTDRDHIQEEVTALLEHENDEGWVIIGGGSEAADMVKLQGRKAMECFNNFPEWEENVRKLGFLDALRSYLVPNITLKGPCNHSIIVPYTEKLVEKAVVCDKCKHPVMKYIIYK